MRPQQNRRIRGRGNNNNNNNNNRRNPNPLSRNYESNGPDVKIRGNAQHIAEKYSALARDAQASGDRVIAENYFQHAEHYNRIILTEQAQMPQPREEEPKPDMENSDIAPEAVLNGEMGLDNTLSNQEGGETEDAGEKASTAAERPRRTRRRLPKRDITPQAEASPQAETAPLNGEATSEDLPSQKATIEAEDNQARIFDMAEPEDVIVEKPRRRVKKVEKEDIPGEI